MLKAIKYHLESRYFQFSKYDSSAEGLFFKCFLTVLLIYALRQPIPLTWLRVIFGVSIPTVFLLVKNPLYHPAFWLLLLAYFGIQLAMGYYIVANHHFVICYLLIVIILYHFVPLNNLNTLIFHTRFLLISILLLSAIHKLLSPYYMSGAFFLFQMDLNIFLKPLKWLVPGWESNVHDNLLAYKNLMATNPNNDGLIELKNPIQNAAFIAKISSWAAVITEATSGIAIFLKSNNRVSHCFLLTSILGVFFFRLETGFLAILSTMGLLLAPNLIFRRAYLALIILFLCLMAAGVGLP